MPYVTGKIAVSKNNLIYSEVKSKITDIHSDRFTHNLRYINDSIMISYKTLNKDDPKLNCRLKRFEKFSPRRIIIDNSQKFIGYVKDGFTPFPMNYKGELVYYDGITRMKFMDFSEYSDPRFAPVVDCAKPFKCKR